MIPLPRRQAKGESPFSPNRLKCWVLARAVPRTDFVELLLCNPKQTFEVLSNIY